MKLYLLVFFLCAAGVAALEQTSHLREKRFSSLKDLVNRFKSRLFSVTCEEGEEELYSNWTSCGWPQGDLRVAVADFLTDAREKGCKIPFRAAVKIGFKHLKESDYRTHPLYERIPSAECGFCGRKTRCCRKARSFLTQTFTSEVCEAESPPCELQPVDDAFLEKLRVWFPDITPPEDSCSVKPYIEAELDRLHEGEAFEYVKPLMCQILGTTRPTVTCKRDGDVCKCCCTGYKYENGRCVATEKADDPLCA